MSSFLTLNVGAVANLVHDDVLQFNEEFIVRHRSTTESAIQQTVGHVSEAVLKLVRFVHERVQYAIKFNVVGPVSLGYVTDQRVIC